MLQVRTIPLPGPNLNESSRTSKDSRLTCAAEYDRVFKNSRRSADRFFTVLYCRNDLGYARLGLAIAKRNVRLAVQRNRLKRIIRQSFRDEQPDLDGVDVVVLARSDARNAPNAKLFDSLRSHWQRIARQEARNQTRHH